MSFGFIGISFLSLLFSSHPLLGYASLSSPLFFPLPIFIVAYLILSIILLVLIILHILVHRARVVISLPLLHP